MTDESPKILWDPLFVDLDLRRNSYASKSVWIVVQKNIHLLDEVKQATAYLFRVNIHGEKSMG